MKNKKFCVVRKPLLKIVKWVVYLTLKLDPNMWKFYYEHLWTQSSSKNLGVHYGK